MSLEERARVQKPSTNHECDCELRLKSLTINPGMQAHTPLSLMQLSDPVYQLWILFGTLSVVHGSQHKQMETFVEDIIDTWQLLSPTIIVQNEPSTS